MSHSSNGDASQLSDGAEEPELRHASSGDILEDRRTKMNTLFGFKPWSVRISKPAEEKPAFDGSEGMKSAFWNKTEALICSINLFLAFQERLEQLEIFFGFPSSVGGSHLCMPSFLCSCSLR